MKFSLSLLSICVLSFILIYSCSTEEEESVAPVIQTPQPEPEPVEYTLTVTAAEGGTVSTDGGTYDEGTEVTITATPDEGYRFSGWEGNDSTNESLTFTMNSNLILQALFELRPDNDYWGEVSRIEPEFFFADNISEFHKNGILESNRIITSYFGNYGPTEWWITSPSTSLAEKNILRDILCSRRIERDDNWMELWAQDTIDYNECMTYGLFENPDNYVQVGSPFLLYNFVVLGHYGENTNQSMYDFPIQLHEYFHVVQANSIIPKNTDHWGWDITSFFKEGSASLYEKYVWRKLLAEGYNIDCCEGSPSLREEFKSMLLEIIDDCSEVSDFYQLDYGNVCDPYKLGPFSVAFLIDKKGDGDFDSYWKNFYPLIKEKILMGINDQEEALSLAMKEFYGLTLEEFNEEFKLFLQLPIEQQLEIIPDI